MELNNSTEKKGEFDDFVRERTEFNDPSEKRLKLDEPSQRLEIGLCSLSENGADPYFKGGKFLKKLWCCIGGSV